MRMTHSSNLGSGGQFALSGLFGALVLLASAVLRSAESVPQARQAEARELRRSIGDFRANWFIQLVLCSSSGKRPHKRALVQSDAASTRDTSSTPQPPVLIAVADRQRWVLSWENHRDLFNPIFYFPISQKLRRSIVTQSVLPLPGLTGQSRSSYATQAEPSSRTIAGARGPRADSLQTG
jgi:hypothetical protein